MNIYQAKIHFSRILQQVEQGEEVVLREGKQQIAQRSFLRCHYCCFALRFDHVGSLSFLLLAFPPSSFCLLHF